MLLIEMYINIKTTFKAQNMKKLQVGSNASSGYEQIEEKINHPE
jgi:hypothetical protein